MNEVTEMLNKERCEKLENKVFSLNSKIDYKEVKEQGFKETIFLCVMFFIINVMLRMIDNGSVLAFGLAVCTIFLIATSAKVIAKKLYILKLRRLNIDDRKTFLTNVFNVRIMKCRRGKERCKRDIDELKIEIDEIKKEMQYSL